MRRSSIRELPFKHNQKPRLGFEIFKKSELFARQPEADLVAPKRLDFHIICVGLRGRGTTIVDFQEVPLGAGHMTIVARGRVHNFLPKPGVDAWLLLARPEVVTGTYALLDPMWMPPAVELSRDDRDELLGLCDQLAAEQTRPLDAIQPRLMEALLSAVLLRGERLVHASASHQPVAPVLQRFFTILEADCLGTREVAHYAKRAGISVRQLSDLLVAHTGKSTKRVIDERVVLEQKRLLAHTDVSVKELAERTGFDEPTNLVKFFRHHTGTTPQAFRRNLPSGRRS
ncbi:MAG TPA: helix-turn-helix domain-containing protein [Kofleriaceae bacterium]|nr:helix-turn-helix domain-containing protein [Kofleriaceae bacterium]